MCGRLTLSPALHIQGRPVGPTCARKRGLMPKSAPKCPGVPASAKKRRKVAKCIPKDTTAIRDDKTLDMFGGAE